MYIYVGFLIRLRLKSNKSLKIHLIFLHMAEKEIEGRGALVTLLIYGTVFAILWFAVYAIALSRGIVG